MKNVKNGRDEERGERWSREEQTKEEGKKGDGGNEEKRVRR